MSLFYTLASLLIAGKIFAATELPLPPSIPGIDNLIETFRSPIQTKISELGENFITHVSDKEITWTSHVSAKCDKTTVPAGLPMSKIQINVLKKSETELVEEVFYIDCYGSTNFKEIIITRGTNLAPASINEIQKGLRTLKLKTNETERDYRIINEFGDQLLRISLSQNSEKRSTVFYLTDAPFFEIYQLFLNNETQSHYRFSGYDVSYRYRDIGLNLNYIFTPWMTSVVTKNVAGELRHSYYDSSRLQVSLSKFLSLLNYAVINNPHSTPPLSILRKVITAHFRRFPETQIIASVGQNDRILNELRMALLRLTNNVELPLVKDLIAGYLKAAEDGTLKFLDNRPVE